MNLFTYWNSDKMPCCRWPARRRSTSAPRPTCSAWCASLSQRAGLPMPRVYLMDNPQPNAFATGRNPENAAVAVTTGLLQHLSREEVAGVIAHELAHIKNHDTLIMTITATIAGAISMLAQFGMFFGGNRDNNKRRHGHHRHAGDGDPGADRRHAGADGDQPHPRILRRRARRPDRRAARVARRRRCASSRAPRTQIPNETAERNPATAHMFIVNPLSGAAHGQPVLDPSGDREPHRRAAGAGAPHGPGRRLRRHGAPRQQAPATPGHGQWGGGARRSGPWG